MVWPAARRAAGGSLDVWRTGLDPALDLTLGPAAGPTDLNGPRVFFLEKLEVYPTRWFRQLDKAATSVMLNFAEGHRQVQAVKP
jgi:hypothetical protein